MKNVKLSALLLGILFCLTFIGCASEEPVPEVPETYSVLFNLNGGELISGSIEQVVEEGKAAAAPEAVNGTKTLSWDKDFSNITKDTIVTAQWTANYFSVTFEPNLEGLQPVTVEVESGTAAQIPDFQAAGMALVGWDKDISNVTEDMTVTAQWEKLVMSSVEISEYAEHRIATVHTHDAFGNNGSGSGFFIDSNGTFITNYHVIEFADSIKVEFSDGAFYNVEKVINFSEKFDIAILKVAITGNEYFELSHNLTKGEKVYAIGSALGDLTGSITSGIISSPSRMIGVINCIQMDAAISHGNSGGPLVNEYGEVLGINSFSFTSGQNLNLAINISTLDELPKEKNFTVNDYVEWWRTEVERSYRPTNSSDTGLYTYSIVNTYQNVTNKKCLYSLNELDAYSTDYVNGYDADYLYYIYEYTSSTYDRYVTYIKNLGFEYHPEVSDTYDDGTLSIYYNSSSNLQIMLYVTNEQSFLAGDYVILQILY